MNVVFFTIIVPIYNVEQYLEKCIKSVLQQEKADFELLLVNDGSTDHSGEICMKYSTDSMVVVLHKENGGLSDARNYAHSYVGGKYVLYLDADDYIESKTFLCESKKILQDIPDADVLIYGYKKYFEDSKTFHVYLPHIKEPFLTCSFADAIEKKYYSLSAWGKILKAELINNGLQFEKGVLCEDMVWCISLALNGEKVVVKRDASYIYLQRNGSITKITTKKKIKDIEENIRKSIRIIKKYSINSSKREQIYCFLAQYYSMYIICISLMSEQEQKAHNNFIEQYKVLLKYGNRKREKIIWLLFEIFDSATVLKIIGKIKRYLDKKRIQAP